MISHWFYQWCIALDQFLNACIPSWESWADETFSSRCHRLAWRSQQWARVEALVNWLFFWQQEHCRQSYESEKLRRQSPPESR